MSFILAELDKARKNLLDLSGRNRLTNYRRPTERNGGIVIIDELPAAVYRLLVEQGKSMTFLPISENVGGQSTLLLTDSQQTAIRASQSTDLAARHSDSKLQTKLDRDSLEQRLKRIQNRARTFIEEQGINTLYLAMGLLAWYEAESSTQKREAPLLLVPVELVRDNVRSHYKLQYTGEDIGFNISLQELLLREFAVALPQGSDEQDLDLAEYFRSVAEAVAALPRWQVDTTALFVDFYKFSKLHMYRDLDGELWNMVEPLGQHPVLAKLLGNQSFAIEVKTAASDEAALPAEMASSHVTIGEQVIDADSSQVRAIQAVMDGKNLVIQGPPGTGKSQTITNLIAEAIHQGKSVLFVAEKMAALQVVKRRLDMLELGDLCLELHSNKANKKAFLDELQRTVALGQPNVPDRSYQRKALEEERAYLDRYSRLVNTSVGVTTVTPFQAYGKALAAQQRLPEQVPPVTIPMLGQWPEAEFLARLESVMRCQQMLQQMGTPTKHPFWGLTKRRVLPTDKELLVSLSAKASTAIRNMIERSRAVADSLDLVAEDTHQFVRQCLQLVKLVSQAPSLVTIPFQELCRPYGAWRSDIGEILAVTEQGLAYMQAQGMVDDTFLPAALHENWLPALQAITTHGSRLTRFFSWSYRRAQRRLTKFSKYQLAADHEQQVALINDLITVQRVKPLLDAKQEMCQRCFGTLWDADRPNWLPLRQIADWIQQVLSSELDDNAIDALFRFVHTGMAQSNLHPTSAQLEHALTDYDDTIKQLITTLEVDEAILAKAGILGGAATLQATPLHKVQWLLEQWHDQAERFTEIATYHRMVDELSAGGLDALRSLLETWSEADHHLVNLVRSCRYRAIVEQAMHAEPTLADFDGNTHHHHISRFRELDCLLLEHRRAELLHTHWQSMPRYEAGGLALLKEQFNRKRGHKSIRSLMEDAGAVIQRIKPVFMMSPFSIALYLPANAVTFDLVIFDEASQVQPVDAFGAILRGRQVVVVGDDKQLPPTNFFDKVLEDDNDDDDLVTDLESILAHFRARSAPEAMLEWHYRSRHESLIAVSNYAFYNNRLTVFPSPDKERHHFGLRFNHLPNAHYTRRTDGTGGGYNVVEAQAVADAVLRHARHFPTKTLLVATFNQQQRAVIEDEVERLRKRTPETEDFFNRHPNEPFVVKNLENVQGDERDVVLISVGFGHDQAGKLLMNFGPLNKQGGERRLNVLITRARERCEIFSNITADDIDLAKSNAEGVKALKRFLQYAETGVLDLPMAGNGEAESPFEQAVADALRTIGHRVDLQIGAGGYRVDMAIVDPNRSGRYLLGIECDGATYHRSQSARDRDRLRQKVLEGMGWSIHRIWSTDWFRNPKGELQKVEARIAQAKVQAAIIDEDVNLSVETPQSPNRAEGHVSRTTIQATSYEFTIPLLPDMPNDDSPSTNTHDTTPDDEVIEGEWQLMADTPVTVIARFPSTVASLSQLPAYKRAFSSLYLRGDSLNNLQRAQVEQELLRIVQIESPIHRELLMLRVTDRLTQKVRTWLEPLIERLVKTKQIMQDGDYLLTLSHAQVEPRTLPVRGRSAMDSRDKSIDFLYPVELGNALLLVAVHTPAITREELGKEVLKFIGYSRVTERMAVVVDEIISNLVAAGFLIQRGDRITCKAR